MQDHQTTGVETGAARKIKDAAEQLFMVKGFSATTSRDISKAAGVNLALLNYYFRSKEILFDHIVKEKVDRLFAQVLPVLSDEQTSLAEKFELISRLYTDMLIAEPTLPLFVLSEIQQNPARFAFQIEFGSTIMKSAYTRQLLQKDPHTQPLQHLITFLGMLIFPFIIKPVLGVTGTVPQEDFNTMVSKRREQAVIWMKRILDL